ncbi:hypothetical protein [Streptomyces sp. NPDC088254]|uniref:hypothetical protein n=1 Tax=Streptomyces sp. NPDC088254 TaxID=3365847 RepID=UPI0038275F82
MREPLRRPQLTHVVAPSSPTLAQPVTSGLHPRGAPDPLGLSHARGGEPGSTKSPGQGQPRLPRARRAFTERTAVNAAEYLPNAHLHLYPDAGHGFLYQYAVKFGTEVNVFLDR